MGSLPEDSLRNKSGRETELQSSYSIGATVVVNILPRITSRNPRHWVIENRSTLDRHRVRPDHEEGSSGPRFGGELT
jgi:hypothetical protein